jgi:hypothetical protein
LVATLRVRLETPALNPSRLAEQEPGQVETRMRTSLGWLVLFVLTIASAGEVMAQERPGSTYVQGGVAAGHQDGAADGASQIYITAPGGTTVGWAIAGGVFVAAHVSLEGEWSSTGMMSAAEPARYGLTYHEQRRDRFLGAIVRLHARPGRRLDIEPLAGIGAIRHERWSRTDTYRSWLPADQAVEVGTRIRYDPVTGAAVVAGVDLRAGGRHVAVVPSFRVRTWKRGDDLERYYPGGCPRWSMSVGVHARVDF